MKNLEKYMNRVLVAGQKGFIGSYIWKKKGSEWIGVDLKDNEDVWDAQVNGRCDAVVLLAANLKHNANMYRHNLRIYYWITMLAEMAPDAHVIFTSSAAVYDDSTIPAKEGDERIAPTLYGKSKRLGEDIIRDTLDNYTILRLSNVYGRGSGNGVIDKFRKGEKKIYGDGENIRDYISVDKVRSVIQKILEDPKKYNQQVYNISSGKGMTVNEAFKKYGKGKPKYEKARTYDVKCSILNNTKAKRDGLL